MFKVKYNSLSEAFENYKDNYMGGYKDNLNALPDEVRDTLKHYFDGSEVDDLNALPDEVWDALDHYFDDFEVDDLTLFFEELWANGLLVMAADKIDDLDEGCFEVLYIDKDNNTAYLLQ